MKRWEINRLSANVVMVKVDWGDPKDSSSSSTEFSDPKDFPDLSA